MRIRYLSWSTTFCSAGDEWQSHVCLGCLLLALSQYCIWYQAEEMVSLGWSWSVWLLLYYSHCWQSFCSIYWGKRLKEGAWAVSQSYTRFGEVWAPAIDRTDQFSQANPVDLHFWTGLIGARVRLWELFVNVRTNVLHWLTECQGIGLVKQSALYVLLCVSHLLGWNPGWTGLNGFHYAGAIIFFCFHASSATRVMSCLEWSGCRAYRLDQLLVPVRVSKQSHLVLLSWLPHVS